MNTSSSFKLTSLLFFILNNISFGWSVSEKFAPGPWQIGSATFYGGHDGGGTMGGACGYGNLFETGYGTNTAALSTALFSNGQTCGACYEIQCLNSSQHCITSNAITITATNFCPPNYNLPNDNGGWCNPPRQHFDMSQPAFEQIAIYRAGIIPIAFRRVPCVKSGGIRYTIKGNPYFNLVLVSNVAGAGDVVAVWLKGEFTEWIQMTRNWGQNWQNGDQLNYQSLSFRVMTSDQAVITNWNVVPRGWQFGQTFQGDQNFNN